MNAREQATADLNAALRKWNAIATASFPDLKESLEEARRELGDLLHAIEERRVLSQNILLKGNGTGEALANLPDLLATYHVELRTLAVQANRALRSGREVAGTLGSLSGSKLTLRDISVAEPPETAGDDGLVEALRARVAELESNGNHTHLSVPSGGSLEIEPIIVPPAPIALQDELARLRREVEELREESELAVPDEPVEERIQDEAFDDSGKRRPMGLILLKAGLISTEQLEKALSHQRSAWNRHLGSILVELGFVEEEAVARAIAAQTRVEFVRLREQTPQMDAVRLVSRKLAEHHTVIPLRTHMNDLLVAMANPLDLVALEDLKLASGRPIQPLVATAHDIATAIARYYGALA
jgi:hypothetical protein